jgi:hypothetical protein
MGTEEILGLADRKTESQVEKMEISVGGVWIME